MRDSSSPADRSDAKSDSEPVEEIELTIVDDDADTEPDTTFRSRPASKTRIGPLAPAEEVQADEIIFSEFDAPLEAVEFEEVDTVGKIPTIPNPLKNPLRTIGWLFRFAFGIVSLVLLLAVIAAIPLVNFLALGYLLEIEGRMGRTGKLRFAFPLLDLAPKLGSIALGFALWLLPLRILASAAVDSRWVDFSGGAAPTMQTIRGIAAILVIIHLCLALARGGSLGCFFRPIKNVRWLIPRLRDGEYWQGVEYAIRGAIGSLRLKHHFSLGFRGFIGAAAWLIVPTGFLSVMQRTEDPGPILVTVFGGLLLVVVFAWIPFLQARFATENRLRAMFELQAIRDLFTHAPIAWLIGVVVVYVLALPLYLLKVALPPQDAMWGVTIVFIASIYPAKVLIGWVYYRATTKSDRSWWGFRWMCRAVMLPLLGLYVFLVFFTQAISEHGKADLFQHHAFMLPVPF